LGRTKISFRIFISPDNHPLPLSWTHRDRECHGSSWISALHLMWDTVSFENFNLSRFGRFAFSCHIIFFWIHPSRNRFDISAMNQISSFLVILNVFVHLAFRLQSTFIDFIKRMLRNWHASSQIHFYIVFLSNWSQFLVMFKFYVQNVC
jgi:hypothetical protein